MVICHIFLSQTAHLHINTVASFPSICYESVCVCSRILQMLRCVIETTTFNALLPTPLCTTTRTVLQIAKHAGKCVCVCVCTVPYQWSESANYYPHFCGGRDSHNRGNTLKETSKQPSQQQQQTNTTQARTSAKATTERTTLCMQPAAAAQLQAERAQLMCSVGLFSLSTRAHSTTTLRVTLLQIRLPGAFCTKCDAILA